MRRSLSLGINVERDYERCGKEGVSNGMEWRDAGRDGGKRWRQVTAAYTESSHGRMKEVRTGSGLSYMQDAICRHLFVSIFARIEKVCLCEASPSSKNRKKSLPGMKSPYIKNSRRMPTAQQVQ